MTDKQLLKKFQNIAEAATSNREKTSEILATSKNLLASDYSCLIRSVNESLANEGSAWATFKACRETIS